MHPQDLEKTVEQSHPSLRPNSSAAFSVEIDHEERLVIVAELERRYCKGRQAVFTVPVEQVKQTSDRQSQTEVSTLEPNIQPLSDLNRVVGNIREAIARQYRLQPYQIVLIKVGRIPKTSSGKLQRYLCRKAFLTGNLTVISEGPPKLDSVISL